MTSKFTLAAESPWRLYDFKKPSRAVIAVNDEEVGALLWGVGGSLRMEIDEAGMKHLDDLGLHPPSAGVWIWEGKYVWYAGSYEYPLDGSSEPVGTWRVPTDAEWEAIRVGDCPWDDEDWKLHCICASEGEEGWKGFRDECPDHGLSARK